MQNQRTHAEQQAYELGCEHARNAASWTIDGNATREHYQRVLTLTDAGDPELSEKVKSAVRQAWRP